MRAATVRFGVGLVGLAVAGFVVWGALWAAIVPPLFGWSPIAVTSGSMEPHIGPGDLVFVESSDGHDLSPGTVIVFDGPTGDRVTHRIVDVTPDGEYVTRGDAGSRIDSTPVAPSDVEGVGRMIVPEIGRPILWVADGRWVTLLLAAIAGMAAAWVSRWALLPRFNPWSNGSTVPAAPPPPPGTTRPVMT